MNAIAHRPERLDREAVAWLTLFSSGEVSVSQWERFRSWCDRSPDHAAAFEAAGALWEQLPSIRERARERGLVPPVEPIELPERRPLLGRRLVLAGALAGTAAAGALAALRPPLSLWPSAQEALADVRTRTGERRTIAAPGGASLELNTRTSVNLRPRADADEVELVDGEAVVDTGAAKRVVVHANGGRTIADRARFDVRAGAEEVRVTCLEGTVEVEHRRRTAVLGARQQLTYGGRGLDAPRPVDPAVVTAWREGVLVFVQEPLARAIDEVNRYRPGRIVVVDSALGRRPVTARFTLDRLDDVVSQVERVFGARVRRLPGGVVLLG